MKPLEVLAAFCSKDPDRPIIQRPYFDGERLVSTDGHRLFVTKDLGGNAHSIVGLVSLMEMVHASRLIHDPVLSGKFPDWRQVLPTAPADLSGRFRVPRGIVGFTGSTCAVNISPRGFIPWGVDSPDSVTFDLCLLAPLAGEEVELDVRFGDGAMPGPLTIRPLGAGPNLDEASWFAIVMPLRRGGSPVRSAWSPNPVAA